MVEYLDRGALCDALSENVRDMPPTPAAYWSGYASAASFVGHFPGDYDWWCEPVPPREFKSNIEETRDE